MKRNIVVLMAGIVFGASLLAQAAEIRIKPERLNPNGKRPRMKVVILDVDPEAVDTSSITLNGLEPIKTKVNPNKVTAFFSKKDVVASLGDVEKGQIVTLNVSFSVGDSPATVLTDEVKIVGKVRNTPDQPNVPDTPNAQRPL